MITHIKGRITELNTSFVVLDVSGIGYGLSISLNTYESLVDKDIMQLFTHLIIREDAHLLYGFSTQLEREAFRALLRVGGVGAATALVILSYMNVEELQRALLDEDVVAFNKIKGIGLKTAQRIIIELKGSFLKNTSLEITSGSTRERQLGKQALEALEVLGFLPKTTEKVIEKILKENNETTLEQLIKEALKQL